MILYCDINNPANHNILRIGKSNQIKFILASCKVKQVHVKDCRHACPLRKCNKKDLSLLTKLLTLVKQTM